MSLRPLRTLALTALLVSPACVVKLTDRNSAIVNGGVTGLPADCSKIQVTPKEAPFGTEAKPKFVGRFATIVTDDPQTGQKKEQIVFDWSGNYVRARFEGSEVTVGLDVPRVELAPPENPLEAARRDKDRCSKKPEKDIVFEAVVDDRPPFKFVASNRLDEQGKKRTAYLIADGLGPGPHEVTIHRNTEALYGGVAFTGFNFGATGKFLPPTERPRRIEIIGDSITCGYGNEGTTATCPFSVELRECSFVPVTENNYLAYGSIAARAFNADAVTLCWSGRGVSRNYRDPIDPNTGKIEDDATTLMPDFYERTVASDKTIPWDFTKEPEPQVVVINLGTNDFARDQNTDNVPDGFAGDEFPKFREKYATFLGRVRALRPNAHVFLALPPMVTDQFPLDNARSDLRTTLLSLVDELNRRGDAKVYFIELVEQGFRYGLGCDYHPNLEVHRIMADQVIGAIRSKTCW